MIKTKVFMLSQKLKLLFGFLFCFAIFADLEGQSFERCNTDENYERLKEKDPQYAKNRAQIESQIEQAILQKEVVDGIIVVPVVFHVMHNGDAIGSGENLSNALLQGQLDQMTDDFRRMNSDAGNTPAMFTGVAADTEIEFCLAQVDPSGNSTTGINRYNISTFSGVSESDCWDGNYIDTNFKIPTIWNSTNYLNIWTTVKVQRDAPNCANTVLGYAQFPGGAANTDGLVLRASTVGSIANPNPAGGAFAIGRTGTHEAGHYFNLNHIWGNGGGCTIDDGVSDTPMQSTDNGESPPCTFPGPNSCNTGAGDQPDMFQNYMDYSDDACMNLFTQGQKNRMIAAINTSRPGLLTASCTAETCEDNLVLSGALDGEYYANNTISTSGATNVNSSADVELRASENIYLGYGFSTSYGAALYVGYGVCDIGIGSLSLNDENQLKAAKSEDIQCTDEEIVEMIARDRGEKTTEAVKQSIMTEAEMAEIAEMIERDREGKPIPPPTESANTETEIQEMIARDRAEKKE